MKVVRTVVVVDRGNLIDSQEWAAMHETYVSAIRGVVHPPGNDKFVIRRKTRKISASGARSNQWMRNGVVPIRDQFLGKLREEGWEAERPVGLERGSLALQQVHEKANVLFKDYPDKTGFRLDDQNW